MKGLSLFSFFSRSSMTAFKAGIATKWGKFGSYFRRFRPSAGNRIASGKFKRIYGPVLVGAASVSSLNALYNYLGKVSDTVETGDGGMSPFAGASTVELGYERDELIRKSGLLKGAVDSVLSAMNTSNPENMQGALLRLSQAYAQLINEVPDPEFAGEATELFLGLASSGVWLELDDDMASAKKLVKAGLDETSRDYLVDRAIQAVLATDLASTNPEYNS